MPWGGGGGAVILIVIETVCGLFATGFPLAGSTALMTRLDVIVSVLDTPGLLTVTSKVAFALPDRLPEVVERAMVTSLDEVEVSAAVQFNADSPVFEMVTVLESDAATS